MSDNSKYRLIERLPGIPTEIQILVPVVDESGRPQLEWEPMNLYEVIEALQHYEQEVNDYL